MAKLDEFYRNATDAEWETIAAKRARIKAMTDPIEAEAAAAAFRSEYGFNHESVRNYELMHFQDLSRIKKAEQEAEELRALNAELTAKLQQLPENGFPEWRKVHGVPTKVSLYTTKESIDKLNEVVDRIEEEYGCKRAYAIAFVLEEAAKKFFPGSKS